MAPDARIVSLKVGVADGGVDVSQVIAAIDWVVQHRNDNGMNIRVLNLSYGTNSTQPYAVDPLAYAVEQAWKAGHRRRRGRRQLRLPEVARARQASPIPAYDPSGPRGRRRRHDGYAVACGTTRWPSFSAERRRLQPRMRAPDIVAPGTHMQGLRVPGSYIDQNNPGGALERPLLPRQRHLARRPRSRPAQSPLLLQKYPQLTPDQVKAMLMSNSDKLHSFNWKDAGLPASSI